MSNKMMEHLLDISTTTDSEGNAKFSEKKLRDALKDNTIMASRNKDLFEEHEPKFNTCLMYEPCPICDKCLNKASHLYVRCQSCQITACKHTDKDKNYMIKRKNFVIDFRE